MVLNPVEHRLMALAGHWESFRDNDSKRLLIWQADDSALRFYHCFFEVQKHETEYTVGDLFIVFDTPFQNAIQYSRGLKENLWGQYDASREDLTQQGITPDWQFNSNEIPDSALGFIQSLSSFESKHRNTIGNVVAVLMPSQVVEDDLFASWLTRVLAAELPRRLRLVVLDSLETSRLSQLIGSGNELIHVDTPKINALTTAQETFAQEAATGPAGVFRNLLMGLMTLVEKGPIEKVRAKASDALVFARREKWKDQEVVITMLVAGALLKEQCYDEAIKEYKGARKAANLSAAEGHPSGQQMSLQTWFGEAGVYLAAEDLEGAVECYDHAATLAQELPDIILAVEAFRMGSFCLARMKNFNSAIDRGLNALTMGEQLEPDMRSNTSLPIAALDLLRIIDLKTVEKMEDVKYQQEISINEANKKAEQSIEKLEQNTNNQLFEEVEKKLEEENIQSEQGAVSQIDTLAVNGTELFKKVFGKARELLGRSWPLDTLYPLQAQIDTTGKESP